MTGFGNGPLAAIPLRVLMVVELGANWGHFLRLRPVVQALQARGHRVAIAAADTLAATKAFEDQDVEVFPSPAVSRPGADAQIDHYAQMLDQCVFGSESDWIGTLQRWRLLSERWLPDVLLTDFAPAALLVARLHNMPLVQVATGWEAPPPAALLPSLRPGAPSSQAMEAQMVDRINVWCKRFGAPVLKVLSDLYAVGTQLLAVLPESDHFGPRQNARYIGPIFSSAYGSRVDWRTDPADARTRRVLVYLAPDARNFAILQALRTAPAEVIAVLPGMDESARRRLETPGLRISSEPLQLEALLPAADLVITNGGLGMIGASLINGVPMLTLPRTLEQAIMTSRLLTTGAVLSILDTGGVQNAAKTINQMLTSATFKEAAAKIRRKYAGSSQLLTLMTVVHCVEEEATAKTIACRWSV